MSGLDEAKDECISYPDVCCQLEASWTSNQLEIRRKDNVLLLDVGWRLVLMRFRANLRKET